MQEDELASLHVIASFLLFDGKENEPTFEMMNREGCFPRLIELIKLGKRDDGRLHRLLLELLYEMSRVQRISAEDLGCVDDDFVVCLFDIIEELSDDVDDPYHYPVIRVLVGRSSLVLRILTDKFTAGPQRAVDGSSYGFTNRGSSNSPPLDKPSD